MRDILAPTLQADSNQAEASNSTRANHEPEAESERERKISALQLVIQKDQSELSGTRQLKERSETQEADLDGNISSQVETIENQATAIKDHFKTVNRH